MAERPILTTRMSRAVSHCARNQKPKYKQDEQITHNIHIEHNTVLEKKVQKRFVTCIPIASPSMIVLSSAGQKSP